MAQFSWPALSVSTTNPANGSAGAIAPSTATEVGGVDPSGNLQALQVTAAKRLITDGSQVTQPVSATALPLPTGAATSAKQPALGTAGTASADVLTVQGAAGMTAVKTDGSGVTQPISATALPLPAGAATAAKQPALGTAGTASSDVLTVQGASGMTPLKTDGSGVTQPVSGSVSISNLPATQAVSGSVSVSNLPATQTVAGTVAVSNLPATQAVSGTVNTKTVTATVGTITQAALTVGTTAVRATVSGSAPAATRTVLVITPDASATGKFYLGSSTVTATGTTRGIQFRAGQSITINADAADYYIVSDTASQTVYVMEQA